MPLLAENSANLWQDAPVHAGAPADCTLVRDLRSLALQQRDLAHLAADLFETLRKHSGGPQAQEILLAIQALAAAKEPAGARLLAAFLDVATPAGRLLPLVQRFGHARRLVLSRLGTDPQPGLVMADWRQRLQEAAQAAEDVVAEEIAAADLASAAAPDPRAGKPGWEPPWGALRSALQVLTDRIAGGQEVGPPQRMTMARMLRLEVDAWQERISQLAGTIDPFRVRAVMRLLPILSSADGQVRDLRHLIRLIEEGSLEEAFLRPRSRAHEVMEERDLACLERTLQGCPDLAPLCDLFTQRKDAPLPIAALAHGMARLQALAARLQRQGLRRTDLDPLTAALLVQSGYCRGEVALPCPAPVQEAVQDVLQHPAAQGNGPGAWPLTGVELLVGQLVVVIPEAEDLPPPWLHHLPTPDQRDPALGPVAGAAVKTGAAPAADEQEEELQDMSPSAMKTLVMCNLQSTSLLLGFLRNAKFTSVPGLVEEVVNRTRSAMVIETIANDRTLHTGFANRGVPTACLRSPVNVSIKTLRKFIHVKYVSKVELKRMAQDRTGIRQEVGQEIRKYLENLA